MSIQTELLGMREKPIPCTAPQKACSSADVRDVDLSGALRIEALYQTTVISDEGNEGNVMILRHRMMNAQKILIIDLLHFDIVLFIWITGFKSFQCMAATVDFNRA